MEKFGIFELLDTLSALTSAPPRTEETPPPPAADAAETKRADVNDAAFAPPPSAFPLPERSPAQPQTNAFAALIARHENISKKIDGKKKG